MKKSVKEEIGFQKQASKRAGCFFTLISIICMFMNGCSLANPELQDIKKGDQLIGIFVTFEEDLKDYMMQEGDTLYYQEKKLVRADGSVRELSEEEIEGFNQGFTVEGVKQGDGNYNFGGLNGYYFGYDVTKEAIGGKIEEVGVSFTSPKVFDCSTNINESNEGRDVTSSGTIGVSSGFVGVLRVNDIYKRSDGSVYVRIPSHAGLYIGNDSGGGSYSQSISQSVQSTIDGNKKKSKTESRTFTVTVEQADILKSAIIKQMDATDNVILETTATFEQLESEFLLDDKTAYVIVEESFIDEKGEDYIKRTVYDCGNIRKNDEETEIVSHIFHYTDKNKKIKLVYLNFVR